MFYNKLKITRHKETYYLLHREVSAYVVLHEHVLTLHLNVKQRRKKISNYPLPINVVAFICMCVCVCVCVRTRRLCGHIRAYTVRNIIASHLSYRLFVLIVVHLYSLLILILGNTYCYMYCNLYGKYRPYTYQQQPK